MTFGDQTAHMFTGVPIHITCYVPLCRQTRQLLADYRQPIIALCYMYVDNLCHLGDVYQAWVQEGPGAFILDSSEIYLPPKGKQH